MSLYSCSIQYCMQKVTYTGSFTYMYKIIYAFLLHWETLESFLSKQGKQSKISVSFFLLLSLNIVVPFLLILKFNHKINNKSPAETSENPTDWSHELETLTISQSKWNNNKNPVKCSQHRAWENWWAGSLVDESEDAFLWFWPCPWFHTLLFGWRLVGCSLLDCWNDFFFWRRLDDELKHSLNKMKLEPCT